MSLAGNGASNIIKADLENQKSSTGYTTTVFAHKATAGQTGINLSSLTFPTEMGAFGFSNPPTAALLGANLFANQKSLKLLSLASGELVNTVAFQIATSGQLNFINGYVALEGEIFVGTIYNNPTSGVRVVDARAIRVTGTLAATVADFNVGTPFVTNDNPTYQMGAVRVKVDGVEVYRNSGNSSVVLDGSYYEVPVAGSLYSSVIRFNVAHPSLLRNISVESVGLLADRPDGSFYAAIDNVLGQQLNMATILAAVANRDVTAILGAAPTNQDLKAFGDLVLSMVSPLAALQLPTSQSDVVATRLGQKVYLAGTSYNGGNSWGLTGQAGFSLARGAAIPYQTQDGNWKVRIIIAFTQTSGTTADLTVSGMSFNTILQPLSAVGNSTFQAYVGKYPGSGSVLTIRAATTAETSWAVSGDLELLSKPAFAY